MKIAILTPTFSAFSGPDRVVELQAEELVKKGNQVTVFALKAGIKPKGYKVVELGMPKNNTLERIYRLLFFIDLPKISRAGKMLNGYDLAISHLYPMNLIALYAKKHFGVTYRYHNHGVAEPGLFGNFPERMYMRLFTMLSNHTIRGCDEAVSISKYLKQILLKETGVKSRVEYDKIDKRRFNRKVSGESVRRKYRLGKSPICLYVGRLSPHKGAHLLIQAFNLVLKKVPDARLIIVGKKTFPGYAKKLKTLVEKKTRKIIFTGFVDDKDLPKYYGACDVYVTATLWEGFNMPMVEAQECGKPVVAFKIGPHPEVHKRGKLVAEGNIKQFADAIVDIIKQ